MYAKECQNAADLDRLIRLIDRGGWMEIRTSNGEAPIPTDMQLLFGAAIKRMAHEELDRLGFSKMFFSK